MPCDFLVRLPMRLFILHLRRETTDAADSEQSPATMEVPKFMGTSLTTRSAVSKNYLVE